MKNFMLCGLVFVIFAKSSIAQIKRPSATKEDWAAYKRGLDLKDEDWYYRGWTQESIDGDNAPFNDIRVVINNLQKSGGLAAKIGQFQQQASANPFDAKTQYRWVYAEWLDLTRNHKQGTPIQYLGWRKALSRPDSPHSYNYTRLRFFITSENASGKYSGDQRLIEVGERLLKIKPTDRLVAYWLRELRGNSLSLDDKLKNVNDARRVVTTNPRDAKAQASLASAYMNMWLITKRRSHAKAAVAHYKKYLTLAPQGEAFRPHAEHWVKSISETQAIWEKQGTGKAS